VTIDEPRGIAPAPGPGEDAMSDPAIVDTSRLRGKRGVKSRPKGRPVDAEALADMNAWSIRLGIPPLSDAVNQ
jgi:hypothetical protein